MGDNNEEGRRAIPSTFTSHLAPCVSVFFCSCPGLQHCWSDCDCSTSLQLYPHPSVAQHSLDLFRFIQHTLSSLCFHGSFIVHDLSNTTTYHYYMRIGFINDIVLIRPAISPLVKHSPWLFTIMHRSMAKTA